MRHLALILLLAVAASSCTMWKEKQPKTWQSATGPEAFERLLWQEIQAGNWTEVERHIAPTFVATGPKGRYDRTAALEQWKRLKISAAAMGEVEVRPNGDTSVITYVISLSGSNAGEPLQSPLRCLSVWQRQGDAWLLIAHSGIPATAKSLPGN
jgi:hypothetical protein